MIKFKSLIVTSTLVALMFALSGCEVNTSGDINVDTATFKYVKDAKTGICFAIVGSRKTMDWNTSGLGITVVDCAKVKDYIKRDKQPMFTK